MANSLDPSIREQWSMDYQDTAEKVNVFTMIANFRYESQLSVGDTLNRPYVSDVTVNTLGAEGSYTRQDISSTNETLTVTEEKEASFYIKDIDKFQSHYPTREKMANRCAIKLSNRVDGDVLGEVALAGKVLDDADFGGTSGNGVPLNTSNVLRIFSVANRKLRENDNEMGERKFAVMSPYAEQVLIDALGGREDALGASTGINGHIGKYGGFELLSSNATYWTGVLYMATQPTDGDTVTINGVTFTFKTTLGVTAGNVLIGASADAARANLAALINAPATTTAQGVALSAANQNKLKDVVATNDNAADTLTLAAEGYGYFATSETLTAAADVWSAGKEIQHLMFGQGRPVDLVIQRSPKVIMKDRDGYIGQDIVNYLVYGLKTFADGVRRMVDVKIDTSSL